MKHQALFLWNKLMKNLFVKQLRYVYKHVHSIRLFLTCFDNKSRMYVYLYAKQSKKAL